MNAPTTFPTREQALDLAEQLTLHTSVDGLATWRSEAILGLGNAVEALCAFRAANWTNPLADASIWDNRTMSYVEKWRGGIAFGPKDTRHPIEKMMRRAVAAGLPVTVMDDRGTMRFNQERAA